MIKVVKVNQNYVAIYDPDQGDSKFKPVEIIKKFSIKFFKFILTVRLYKSKD